MRSEEDFYLFSLFPFSFSLSRVPSVIHCHVKKVGMYSKCHSRAFPSVQLPITVIKNLSVYLLWQKQQTTMMRFSTIAIVFLHTIATSASVAAAVVPCIPCINRQDVKIGVVHHGVLSTDGAYWVSLYRYDKRCLLCNINI